MAFKVTDLDEVFKDVCKEGPKTGFWVHFCILEARDKRRTNKVGKKPTEGGVLEVR